MTNKGVILGKGYILSADRYTVVIGGANMDILVRPFAGLQTGDSNPRPFLDRFHSSIPLIPLTFRLTLPRIPDE